MSVVCSGSPGLSSVNATRLPDPDSHPLAEPLAQAVVDRLLGFASADTVLWERVLVAIDPQAARPAHDYEQRTRWLMDHTADPVARFERLTGRTLRQSDDPDNPPG